MENSSSPPWLRRSLGEAEEVVRRPYLSITDVDYPSVCDKRPLLPNGALGERTLPLFY
ncbi:MAG: hypothetical protein ACSHX8_10345 [Opitutaceae bacterium]